MHCENFSAACCSFACSCGVGLPPFGSSFWQACCAFVNWIALTSTPVFWPFRPSPEVILIRPWLSGSGKFGTPCFRMQAE
jgi:hypothetical protein